VSINQKVFDKKYYLDTCFGSDEFKKSGGTMLHSRVKKMIDSLSINAKAAVLEIGCGRGDTAMYVAKKAKSVIATDYSSAAIAIAKNIKKKYPKKIQEKVQFQQMSATDIAFPDNSFDLVLLIDTIDHLNPSEQEKMMGIIKKLLKNRGTLFVRTCSNKILLDTTYPNYSYKVNLLLTSIDKRLKGASYDSLPKDPRTKDEKIQHINELSYFSLQKLFQKYGFDGTIVGEAGLIKEGEGVRTMLYNFLIGLHPFSKYYPLNIYFASSFLCTMKLKK
jgi:ubiquinone/menaquinone biosynthesis C-methylase UbiE